MTKQFKLTIDIDSDAFSESPQYEIARILKQIAISVEEDSMERLAYYQNGTARDSNGNVVARYAIKNQER